MPLSKRLKDAITSLATLRRDLNDAQQALRTAESFQRKAKEAHDKKVQEILLELDSCLPTLASRPERVIEVDGKTYLITGSPKDLFNSADFPSYVREITVEK